MAESNRGADLAGRAQAAWAAARAAFAEERARRREQRALRELGRRLAAGEAGVAETQGLEGVALRGVARLEAQLQGLTAAARASLDRDRDDFAAVSRWAVPLVIARGILDRAVLHSRRLALAPAHRAACEELGRLAHPRLAAAPDPSPAAAAALRAFEERKASRAERRRLLALAALPRAEAVLPALRREATALGTALARELRSRLLPSLPGLAGLAAGWWLAQTFTDSSFQATLHRLGLGSGPRRSLDPETYRALSFWLPLAAATLCSYASARLTGWVRARYAPEPSGKEEGGEGVLVWGGEARPPLPTSASAEIPASLRHDHRTGGL